MERGIYHHHHLEMLVYGDNKKQTDFQLILLFLTAPQAIHSNFLACFQDGLLPPPILLGMPMFTDELDAVQKFPHDFGSLREISKCPQRKLKCEQKSEGDQ